MTWAHVNEDGVIDWTSEVEQKGLVQLDFPVLEEGEVARYVNGSVVVEKEEAGEAADELITHALAEIRKAKSRLKEAQPQETPEEAQAAASSNGQLKFPPMKVAMLPVLLSPDAALPEKLFAGRSCTQACEFSGDFADWTFLNCEPDEKQRRFIKEYCKGRKLDALFLCCPIEGRRVSFADVLIGTDKAMLHKHVLDELQEKGIATSGIEFRAALFKGYCTAHCGVFLNEEAAIETEAEAERLADEALGLLKPSLSEADLAALEEEA